MNVSEILFKKGLLNQNQVEQINNFEGNKPMSVYWELKTILYLGVLLLMSGLGILIYKNIDTIGHTIIILAIAALCFYCFYYCFNHRKSYSNEAVKHDSPFFDHIVLLACLLFGLLIGYLQYQYTFFGTHLGIALILPAILYLLTAYLFDHKGVLSLGITSITSWAGISMQTNDFFKHNNFSNVLVIWTSIVVGIILTGFSKYADIKNIKKHFGFTYNNFACNILCIALLSALFNQSMFKYLYLILIATAVTYYFKYAIKEKSLLFLLLAVIYGYIAFTYFFFSILLSDFDLGSITFAFFYAFISCLGIVLFFLNYKKLLGLKK